MSQRHPVGMPRILWRIVVRPAWWWVVTVPLFFVGGYDTVQAQVFPDEDLPAVVAWVPSWPIWAWGFILLGIVIAIILGSSVSLIKQAYRQLNTIEAVQPNIGFLGNPHSTDLDPPRRRLA